MQQKLQKLREYADSLGCTCKENEPMSRHTSFKIGGPVSLLIQANSTQALAKVMRRCAGQDIRLLYLGNGSNLLISDKGLKGVALKLDDSMSPQLQGSTIICSAATSLTRLCRYALDNSLTGLEFAFGIPGSSGGAAYMNAGAYGGEMKDILQSCDHITPDGEEAVLPAGRMELGYRHSVYAHNGCFITRLHLTLKPGDNDAIRARMEELMHRRSEKQPLEHPSAGSIFKRPPGGYAGTLIEQCSLKGKTVGGAQVSEKHAGFIINIGGATCNDVQRLIEHIQQTVYKQTGIALECEIKVIEF